MQARTITNQPEIDDVEPRKIISMPQPQAPGQAATPLNKGDVLSRLADVATSLRTAANDVEAIALDVKERFATIEKDTEKLRQFQALLKSIGT